MSGPSGSARWRPFQAWQSSGVNPGRLRSNLQCGLSEPSASAALLRGAHAPTPPPSTRSPGDPPGAHGGHPYRGQSWLPSCPGGPQCLCGQGSSSGRPAVGARPLGGAKRPGEAGKGRAAVTLWGWPVTHTPHASRPLPYLSLQGGALQARRAPGGRPQQQRRPGRGQDAPQRAADEDEAAEVEPVGEALPFALPQDALVVVVPAGRREAAEVPVGRPGDCPGRGNQGCYCCCRLHWPCPPHYEGPGRPQEPGRPLPARKPAWPRLGGRELPPGPL